MIAPVVAVLTAIIRMVSKSYASPAAAAGARRVQVSVVSPLVGCRLPTGRTAAGATCLVNDRADVALAVGADGVHVGADDLPVAIVRRLVGPDLFVGGTARDPETGRRLVGEGASYLGVGPTFATKSKAGLPEPIGVAGQHR